MLPGAWSADKFQEIMATSDDFLLTDANSLPESNSDLITTLTGLDVNNFSDHIVSLLLVTFNVELIVK